MTIWHASPGALVEFATDPARIDETAAASLELHLLSCGECRDAIAAAADHQGVAASWDAVADRIDEPKPSPVERLLRRLGVTHTFARLVGATRALQVAWLAALAFIVAGTVLVAQQADSPGFFLVIAPLVPLSAVALAFGAGADPAGEAGAVAPVSGVGLVLRRAVAVVGATLVLLIGGAFALPDLAVTDAAWVLPALGLSLGGLALATWIRVESAALLLGFGWLAALWLAVTGERGDPPPVADLAPLAAPGQLVCAAIALAALAVLALRRDTFASLGRTA